MFCIWDVNKLLCIINGIETERMNRSNHSFGYFYEKERYFTMAKKPLEENGIHRAKLWEIGFYALNNTSTNTYMLIVSMISYYMVGMVGVSAVLAGSFATIMRIWDGVTDPFVGMIVDKTNTRFGKNRPFIVIGNIILFVASWLMYHATPLLPQSSSVRLVAFTIMYMIYIIGYTCQCVVTKSAQTCLTNDPAQRPVFAMFDTVYNLLLFSFISPVLLQSMWMDEYTWVVPQHQAEVDGFIAKSPWIADRIIEANGVQILPAPYNPAYFSKIHLTFGIISAVFMVLAVIGLSRKDNSKYYGTGKAQKVGVKDYVDCICHNRAIQMLVVSASTDKLFTSFKSNSAVLIAIFGITFGNYSLYASFSQISAIPIAVGSILVMNFIACKMGQKMSMLVGSWGGIIIAAVMTVFVVMVNPKGDASVMLLPAFNLLKPSTYGTLFAAGSWSAVGVIFVLLSIAWAVVTPLAGSIVITMTADCADYEVYRTGKYVPGLMGTLFSFVDKLVSSLASTFVALLFAMVGFADALPTRETPYSDGIFWVGVFCYFGAPIIGWLCNVVAMKFYPLTKEKMEEIQGEIARIKAEAAAENA